MRRGASLLQSPGWGRGGPSHVFSCFVSSVVPRVEAGLAPRPLKPRVGKVTEIRNRAAATSLSGYPNWSTQAFLWLVPDDPSSRLATARDCVAEAGEVHPCPANSRSRSASHSGRFQISRWSRTPTNVTSRSSAVRFRIVSGIRTRPCLSGSR